MQYYGFRSVFIIEEMRYPYQLIRNMKKHTLFLHLLAALFFTGCTDDTFDIIFGGLYDYPIYYLHVIRNNSGFDIFSYQAANNIWAPTVYPDTLLPESFNNKENRFFCCYDPETDARTDTLGRIRPGTDGKDWCYPWKRARRLYEQQFEKDFPAGYYSVIILSYESYLEKGWEGIRDDYDILVRYDLTYDNLKVLNDTIPFPPTEAMKNMKMWPPYEEVVKKYKNEESL